MVLLRASPCQCVSGPLHYSMTVMLLFNVVDISIYLKNSFNKSLLVFFPQGRHLEILKNNTILLVILEF